MYEKCSQPFRALYSAKYALSQVIDSAELLLVYGDGHVGQARWGSIPSYDSGNVDGERAWLLSGGKKDWRYWIPGSSR